MGKEGGLWAQGEDCALFHVMLILRLCCGDEPEILVTSQQHPGQRQRKRILQIKGNHSPPFKKNPRTSQD